MTLYISERALKSLHEVFGPCTVVGESMTTEELREDLGDFMHDKKATEVTVGLLREWFDIRLHVELNDIFPECKYPDGPTEEQLAKERKVETETRKRLVAGFSKWLQTVKQESRV